MGLEVPDRFDRMQDMVTAQEFVGYLCTRTFKHPTRAGSGAILSLSMYAGEMLLSMASGIRH